MYFKARARKCDSFPTYGYRGKTKKMLTYTFSNRKMICAVKTINNIDEIIKQPIYENLEIL